MGGVSWGQGAQGAAGGAMAGGAMGGPVGALIGGVGGGLMGLFGGNPQDEYQQKLQKLYASYQNRSAPQGGAASQAGQSSLVGNRAALIAQLEAQAHGEGPSAARLQMQDGMSRAVAAQASNAAGAGGRGVNAGAANRMAGNNSAAIMSQGNRDMGVVRAQEQANAMGQLGQNIGQGINSDNQMSQFNTGQTNSRDDLNLALQMQMQQMNQQGSLQALQLGMGSAGPGIGTQIMAGGAQAMPGLMQMSLAQQQQQQAQQQQLAQQYQQQMQNPNAAFGGMGGSVGALSQSPLNPFGWNK